MNLFPPSSAPPASPPTPPPATCPYYCYNATPGELLDPALVSPMLWALIVAGNAIELAFMCLTLGANVICHIISEEHSDIFLDLLYFVMSKKYVKPKKK
jgi:hypothetical protein